MCRPKPYPRCSRHAKNQLDKLRAKLDSKVLHSKDYFPLLEKVQSAQEAFDMTPVGLTLLSEELIKLPADSLEYVSAKRKLEAARAKREELILLAKTKEKVDEDRLCASCSKPLKKSQTKYCSNECHRIGSRAPQIRSCASCGRLSTEVRFAKHSRTPDKLSTLCADCASSASRARWHGLSIEERRARATAKREKPTAQNAELLRTYGITLEEFNLRLVDQRNCCKICKVEFDSRSEINVDHDHQTELVRGLLCRRCNTGLGRFGDIPEKMLASIRYLETQSLNIASIRPLLIQEGEKQVDFRHDRRVKISTEGKRRVLRYQGNKCAICDGGLLDGFLKAHLDHNHTTGEIRGYLCSGCNQGIGLFKEDPELLLSAQRYLTIC